MKGDFLKATLRPGNQYNSNGVKEFIEPLLDHYNQAVPTADILVRDNSGFVTPDIYELCEKYKNQYVIRLKNNRNLARLAEEFLLYNDNHHWEEKEVYFHSVSYQAASWSKLRGVCIRSTREAGELLFSHVFTVTSFSENISAKRVFETYKKRGTMETTLKKPKIASSLIKQSAHNLLEITHV